MRSELVGPCHVAPIVSRGSLGFPKRKDAEKAVTQLRFDVNDGAAFAPMNMEQLAAHFERVEIPLKSHSTAEGYKNYLKLHIIPKWGQYALSAMKSVEVESWLRNLTRIDGKQASPGTKTKIRNLLSTLFSHAIRYELAARNPTGHSKLFLGQSCELLRFQTPTWGEFGVMSKFCVRYRFFFGRPIGRHKAAHGTPIVPRIEVVIAGFGISFFAGEEMQVRLRQSGSTFTSETDSTTKKYQGRRFLSQTN